jgi:DNA modification methylase
MVADKGNTIRAGVGRYEASKFLKLSHVPVVRMEGLSAAKMRAFTLADNKIAEHSRWDRNMLAIELPELTELLIEENLDIAITGFSSVEIDQISIDFEENSSDPEDDINEEHLAGVLISRAGDHWRLGVHQLSCGDARDADTLKRLIGDSHASMGFFDPPYNVSIKRTVGRGRVKHAEFAMASGEMQPAEFVDFLKATLGAAASVSRDGAVHFVCMDWRHVDELVQASRPVYGAMLNLAVWVKSNPGQGSFYRSQHELVGIFRVGDGPHLNNVELGRHGRSRSNVWNYAGTNYFRSGRSDDLRSHPTVKPIALVCDAIKDCTRRGDTIIDTFCGSGTTVLAAERVGRRAVGVEIEPRFVDLAIRRWQDFTGKDAIHVKSGRCFNETAAARNDHASESEA